MKWSGARVLLIWFGLALLVLGFVWAERYTSNTDQVPIYQVSTVLPDLQYIPLYPDAKIITAYDESYRRRALTFDVSVSVSTVAQFYSDVLPKSGWVVQYDDELIASVGSHHSYHIWTDASNSLPWQLYLTLIIRSRSDGTTKVDMTFGRVPIVNKIPVLPDAEQTEVTRTEEPGDPIYGGFPVYITTRTYFTRASPQEVADFYKSTMEQHGWLFSDRCGLTVERSQTRTQTESIAADESLFFVSSRLTESAGTTSNICLHITVHSEDDGRVKVELRAEESKTAIDI